MLLPKAFYLLYFAAMAVLFPFLTLHYEQIGLSGRQIGLLVTLLGLSSFVMAGSGQVLKGHRFTQLLEVQADNTRSM